VEQTLDGRRDSFVIWLDPPGEGSSDCRGHVEHVGSATRVRFGSGGELLRFLRSRSAAAPAEGSAGSGTRSGLAPTSEHAERPGTPPWTEDS
jgi:hypothetical protein